MKYPALTPFALALAACGGNSEATLENNATEPAERVASVSTVVLEGEEVTDLTVMSADLLPLRRATLAAEVPGTISDFLVDLGDRVRKGQTLVRIDTRALRQQIAEAEALFAQAQDRFERSEKLFASRSITRGQQIDAVASRDVAKALLASAKLALEKSEIKAPWSGSVAEKRAEVGDYAAPGQPLLVLVQVNRLKVRAPAPAADVPYLKVGTPLVVRVDVFPGETFSGKVVRLGAELDPDTRTLDVEVELDNRDGRLRPGMFGRLEVPRRVIANALLVPLAALVDFETEKVVYVVQGERAQRRTVTLGPMVGDRVVVASGLLVGDRVIVAGQRLVADGQLVAEAEEARETQEFGGAGG